MQWVTTLYAAVSARMLLQSDKTVAGDTPEKTVENALWAFKQEIKHKTENVGLGTVINCDHCQTICLHSSSCMTLPACACLLQSSHHVVCLHSSVQQRPYLLCAACSSVCLLTQPHPAVAAFLQLNDVVLEAVVSCSHKTLHYAVLLGEQIGNEHTWPACPTHVEFASVRNLGPAGSAAGASSIACTAGAALACSAACSAGTTCKQAGSSLVPNICYVAVSAAACATRPAAWREP
jgi:hypothetical protein